MRATRELGPLDQAGRVGQAEQLGQVQQRARALLAADHREMRWWPFSQAMKTTPVL